MASDNKNNDFEKPNVDEEYSMNVISGDEPVAPPSNNKKQDVPKETKPREKARNSSSKESGLRGNIFGQSVSIGA